MDTFKKRLIVFVLISLPLLLLFSVIAACNLHGKTTTIIIPIGGGEGKDLTADTPPLINQITSVVIRVSGKDISPVEKTFYPDAASAVLYATMEAPSGNRREVVVIVNLTKDRVINPSAALQVTGKSIADLPPGETVYLTLTMYATETRLIIPDPMNNRLLQFDDMTEIAPAATQPPKSTIAGITGFSLQPWDVDFDRWGRIFIVNNYSSTGGPCLWRLASFEDPAAPLVNVSFGMNGFVAVAVDEKNGFVYFATFSQIFRTNLDGIPPVPETINIPIMPATGGPLINTIKGMDVDESGNLYVAGNISITATAPGVCKLEPDISASTYLAGNQSTLFSLSFPEDVIVKGDLVYVANRGAVTANSQILVLDKNLSTIAGGFGNSVFVQSSAKGEFYGPIRFLAILNRKITVADDASLDKLVSFDDQAGTNWDVFPDSGAGSVFFGFYNC